MKPIPFSPPRIDNETVEAVKEVLLSGWITTGPKTKLLETEIAAFLEVPKVVCLNSWTNACELVLRWFGVGPGDEVIIPSYTYAATANIVEHVGAKAIMLDVSARDFNLNVETIKEAISSKTKVVMPVDIGGLPVDYDEILDFLNSDQVRSQFKAKGKHQSTLGRPLLLSDSAHSFGALYKGKKVGSQADVSGFSFHAVKNLTTAEGGALAFNLKTGFDLEAIYKEFQILSLHGQTKDAMSKTNSGTWRYDIVTPGYKCNMTDLQAAIGLVELGRYHETISKRKSLCERYESHFKKFDWAITPITKDENRESSYHLYMLRLKGFSEEKRDDLISHLKQMGISTNVHFQPLPLLSYYKSIGYSIEDHPIAFASYKNEISLPVYYDLSNEDVDRIANAIIDFTEK